MDDKGTHKRNYSEKKNKDQEKVDVDSDSVGFTLKSYENYEHFSLVRNFHLADFITFGNGLCGSCSIFSSIRYAITNDQSYLWLSMMLMPLGMMFDLFDGKVARWRKTASILGQELDSLADLVSFGVAPAVCAYAVGMRTFLDTILLSVFICCGIARLARYNATVASLPKDKGSGKVRYFEGTPIPTTLFLVALIAYLTSEERIGDRLPGGTINLLSTLLSPLSPPPSSSPMSLSLSSILSFDFLEFHPFVLLFIFSGIAMVSKTLKIPKP
nr:108_t:CDS:2 [Entrophospora candida]